MSFLFSKVPGPQCLQKHKSKSQKYLNICF
jgi:hypothetical protein